LAVTIEGEVNSMALLEFL